jgi:hypothetical protein
MKANGQGKEIDVSENMLSSFHSNEVGVPVRWGNEAKTVNGQFPSFRIGQRGVLIMNIAFRVVVAIKMYSAHTSTAEKSKPSDRGGT